MGSGLTLIGYWVLGSWIFCDGVLVLSVVECMWIGLVDLGEICNGSGWDAMIPLSGC